ncbi:MAG: DUF362 domain-containing protein [Deltaproteobacteria bacterium]|nr:DUF362 domain-containing protein [Deltaproteobacteria bacterium]
MKRVGIACAGVAGASAIGLVAKDEGRDQPPPSRRTGQVRAFDTGLDVDQGLVVVASGGPAEATRKVIEELGGIASFVKLDDKVVIKPNIGWDRTPIQAANTNPIVVATLVEMCLGAGAAEVIVTDHSCNEARRCFTRSGIWRAAEDAGAQIVLPAPHRFRSYDLGGVILGRMPVLAAAVQADRFINVPVAKHHGLSGFTGAMKNLYGVLGGRRNRLHQRIDDSIADLADFIRPTLTVMDATRVLVRNGPVGGDVADTEEIGKIIASVDQVTVDAYSCSLIGLEPPALPYLGLGGERGLGQPDLSRLDVKEVT